MGYALGDMSRVGTIQDVWNMIKTEGRFNTWYAEEKEDMSWTEGLPFCPMVFDREEQITWLENATAPKVI